MKKTTAYLLAFALIFSAILLSFQISSVAAPGDAGALDAEVRLAAGKLQGDKFIPLTASDNIKAGDLIVIRIIPKTNYLVGVSRYVVMFDKNCFQLAKEPINAFTVNCDNSYYKEVCVGFASPRILLPEAAWPENLKSMQDTFDAVAVGTQANSNSANGGYPGILPGDWLFQFELKALKDLPRGTDARVWSDPSWFRSNARPGANAYISKGLEGSLASGATNNYNFKYDFSKADLKLPLAQNQEPITSSPPTSRPSTSSPAPRPTRPGDTVSTGTNSSTLIAPPFDGGGTAETATTRINASGAEVVTEPLKDKDGKEVTRPDGSVVYETRVRADGTEVVVDGEIVTDKDNRYVTDAEGYFVVETRPDQTQAGDSESTGESGGSQNDDGGIRNGVGTKILIAVLVIIVIAGAGFAIRAFMKKKR